MNASYKTIGRYTIEERTSLFYGYYKAYHKRGYEVARFTPQEGLQLKKRTAAACELSRAQAYRYWAKHFPSHAVFNLPQALQVAIDKPCTAHGIYITKDGKRVAYEG